YQKQQLVLRSHSTQLLAGNATGVHLQPPHEKVVRNRYESYRSTMPPHIAPQCSNCAVKWCAIENIG
ncbi:hypothetical protein A2U01_0106391, partial [Trifolium medium]|nr:hypothetical protein [Trifolium medium]